ncbi:MAG TPA: hypothetical protein VK778_04505 [Solirubrobacteraceae bacterium]|jgi:hypothetical protein|nr:hypothetical protein [Solirubrobacteraceae bacterium]
MDSDTFFFIRRTRAHPPGRARHDERRATYGTALEQFEELIKAAGEASPGVRPLPLFYALSQAGRAIAAANLPDGWKLHGHGLSCADLSAADVLDLEIKPSKNRNAGQPDSFHGVAAATESAVPAEPIKLGALWLALPEVSKLLADTDSAGKWPEALVAVPAEVTSSPLERFDRVEVALVGWKHPDGASLVADLPDYSNTAGASYEDIPGIGVRVTQAVGCLGLTTFWPTETADLAGRENTLDRVVPSAPGGERWLRPLVGGAAMNDLMLWWALLFALSMLARYEPAGWNVMLDLDHGALSSHLVRLMDAAVDVVPELVLQALEPSYAMI